MMKELFLHHERKYLRGGLRFFAWVLVQLEHDLEDLIGHLGVLLQILLENAVCHGLVSSTSIWSLTSVACALNVHHYFFFLFLILINTIKVDSEPPSTINF